MAGPSERGFAGPSERSRAPFTDRGPAGSLSPAEPRSWPPGPGSPRGSGGQTTGLERRDRPPQLSGFGNEKWNEKRMTHLQRRETRPGRYQLDADLDARIAQVFDKDLRALQSFCTGKVNLLHRRVQSQEGQSCRHQKQSKRPAAGTSESEPLNCTIPAELFNRIYFKNMRTAPEQMRSAKQHVPSQCPSCNKKRAELAQSTFLRQKKTFLESLLLQEKIDEHLHTTDFLTRIGEAHQGLPRLSDDPQIIWKRLNERSQIGYSGFERSNTG
ncbi:uncharacterized protein C8orf48 homolog [Tupaia chinensis]|uniref:Uncharacterized protein n=1 Tax=Tupaia chinensis TaxID=246437 RepID=L9L0K0_TUPCH|nr:uncharacterized protein C8orf48 homolog [Tupaia chinensis]ELW68740.1 hypothetical protein TREES_T100014593 [Tupaia chinensis]